MRILNCDSPLVMEDNRTMAISMHLTDCYRFSLNTDRLTAMLLLMNNQEVNSVEGISAYHAELIRPNGSCFRQLSVLKNRNWFNALRIWFESFRRGPSETFV